MTTVKTSSKRGRGGLAKIMLDGLGKWLGRIFQFHLGQTSLSDLFFVDYLFIIVYVIFNRLTWIFYHCDS